MPAQLRKPTFMSCSSIQAKGWSYTHLKVSDMLPESGICLVWAFTKVTSPLPSDKAKQRQEENGKSTAELDNLPLAVGSDWEWRIPFLIKGKPGKLNLQWENCMSAPWRYWIQSLLPSFILAKGKRKPQGNLWKQPQPRTKADNAAMTLRVMTMRRSVAKLLEVKRKNSRKNQPSKR